MQESSFLGGATELLNEQGFAKLVPAHERFGRPVAAEKILDFAVLIHALRGAQHRTGNHLQGIRIRHPVALKTLRLLVVEQGKQHAARP